MGSDPGGNQLSVAPTIGEQLQEKFILTPEEAAFIAEETRIERDVDDCRANYLVADLELEEVDPEELARRREEYSQQLHSLILHRCNYAVLNGDPGVETRTMGEHLLEIISTTLIHDKERREFVCDEFSDKKLGGRIKNFIETRAGFRFVVTAALGTTAILGSHIGILPESATEYSERIGEGMDAIAAGLGSYTWLDRKRTRKQQRVDRQELDEREAKMLADPAATERFVGLFGDYVSRPHHDYFIDKVHRAKGTDELEKIIDELEQAIEHHAAHHDVRDIAELVKRYYLEILSDGGLLQLLENEPNSSDAHKKIVLAIMADELKKEEKERDELSGKLKLVAGATIGMLTLGGGAFVGYHPIDSPLPEADDRPKEDEAA